MARLVKCRPASRPALAEDRQVPPCSHGQAAANGAKYVDAYTASIGHDACQLPGFRTRSACGLRGGAA